MTDVKIKFQFQLVFVIKYLNQQVNLRYRMLNISSAEELF